MTGLELKSARAVAVDVLNQFDPRRDYSGPILNRLLGQTDQRQRATDLVFGTIRNRRAIDLVIGVFSGRRTERIPVRVLNVIRVGVYELVHSPQTPDYSVVNEAVENAKGMAGRKQTGFVNAVLREIRRHIRNRQAELADVDIRATLVQSPTTGCEFDTPLLPDPAGEAAEYLAAAFSLPKWLVSAWLGEFGLEETQQVCFACNRRPSIYIRPNSLKTTAEQLAQKLNETGVEAAIVGDASMVRIVGGGAITELAGFAEGLFSIQDVTASHVVRMLDPQPGWRMLDFCAAPGTKTTQLAEWTGDSAEIFATDVDAERLKRVEENTVRLGVNSVQIISYKNIKQEVGPFDAVLVDTPCSNTGVLAKRVEARHRLSEAAINELTKKQGELLRSAAAMLKSGGRICYSTCSIQKEENGAVVRRFLEGRDEFELESERLILPSCGSSGEEQAEFDRDGGYIAVLRRN